MLKNYKIKKSGCEWWLEKYTSGSLSTSYIHELGLWIFIKIYTWIYMYSYVIIKLQKCFFSVKGEEKGE
jgi:hypothetical protein